mgnify:CR=1 FL=1
MLFRSKTKLTELIDSNIFRIEDILEHIEFSEIQTNQINAHVTGRATIQADKIASELESLVYPLYFIDYETFPSAIPRFDGFSPYQQIPFQYSLHIVESPETMDKPIHKEFLHTASDDPSQLFTQSLMRDIGKIGSIIVWNKKFESGINEQLARRVPSIKSFIKDVNSRMYDLMDIFSKQYYVHKDFQGSTSIKYVLPVLAPELSYKKLEIKEGGTASLRWNEMTLGVTTEGTPISPAEKQKIAENLRTYCELDTRAMYEIWRKLNEIG